MRGLICDRCRKIMQENDPHLSTGNRSSVFPLKYKTPDYLLRLFKMRDLCLECCEDLDSRLKRKHQDLLDWLDRK